MLLIARLLSLACLLTLTLAPPEHLAVFKKSEVQLIAATIVVIVLVMLDIYSGIILGIALSLVYYRLYNENALSPSVDTYIADEVRDKGPMTCLINKYITEEHLKNAQNNIVDDAQLDTQVIGVDGLSSDQVFGAQGTYKTLSGLDKSTVFAPAQFR